MAALLMGAIWPRRAEEAPPGDAHYTDSFNRSDNTDLNANCGVGDTCEWVEYGGNPEVDNNELKGASGATYRIVTDADAEATGLNQYVAAECRSGPNNGYTGIALRDDGGSGSGDKFYVLRYNSITNFVLRACESTASCSDIAEIAEGDLLPAEVEMGAGDSIGMEVDANTGDAVTFTLYHWFDQVPPDRGSWGTGWTVCASGCDQGFATAPTATAAGAADTGKRGGIYQGSNARRQWDNWMFGDN
jgi:hypothetical protein